MDYYRNYSIIWKQNAWNCLDRSTISSSVFTYTVCCAACIPSVRFHSGCAFKVEQNVVSFNDLWYLLLHQRLCLMMLSASATSSEMLMLWTVWQATSLSDSVTVMTTSWTQTDDTVKLSGCCGGSFINMEDLSRHVIVNTAKFHHKWSITDGYDSNIFDVTAYDICSWHAVLWQNPTALYRGHYCTSGHCSSTFHHSSPASLARGASSMFTPLLRSFESATTDDQWKKNVCLWQLFLQNSSPQNW